MAREGVGFGGPCRAMCEATGPRGCERLWGGGGHSCTVGSGQEWGRGVLSSKAVGGGGVSS